MGGTLLIRHGGASWNEWVKGHPGDHILLDPSDASHGMAARLTLLHGDKPAMVRFYGSLDPQRGPHVILAALHDFLTHAPDATVHAPVYRPNPVLRQTLHLIAGMQKPKEILIAEGTEISPLGWPVGPSFIPAGAAFPKLVTDAQRKAQWLALVERTQLHEIPLPGLSIEGARLGSGEKMSMEVTEKAGLSDAVHVEISGGTLLIVLPSARTGVGREDLDDSVVARALDVTHAARAMVVDVREYENLLCALVRDSGEEIGHGMVEKFDFENGLVRVWADAVPPVPVRILKLGSLRVDRNGKELGEIKAWSA